MDARKLSIEVGATSDLRWYTDPYLAVSDGGAVYLSVLKWPGIENAMGGNDRGCGGDFSQRDPQADFDEEVQLWAIAPGETTLEKVGVDNNGVSMISAGLNGPGPQRLDHPRLAADSLDEDSDRVVVTFNRFQTDAGENSGLE